MVIAGFDVGTTAVKGVHLDPASGRVTAAAEWRYQLHRPQPGRAEQDPRDWLRGIATCAAELARLDPGARVAAVGIGSQANTHVLVDGALEPLLPAITWQDVRCAGAASEVERRASGRVEELFGGPFNIDASFALSRAEWARQQAPEVWARTRWILSPKDFCVARLTGAIGSDATSSVGLVDRGGNYLAGALALVDGTAARLPPLAPFDARAGATNGELGLPAGLPVSVGTMDAWCSVYGSGVTAGGQAVHVSGTSEILGVMATGPGAAPGVLSFPPVRGRFIHFAPTQAGGDALRWIADVLDLSVEAALARAVAAAPEPIVFLPHLAGERAPLWNADASAVFVGVTSSTSSGALVRAVLEGVAHAARQARESCEQAAGFDVPVLRLSGGASRSASWNQIKADAHRRPLERVADANTGCIGAALMGGVAAGMADDLETWAAEIVAVGETYEPDRSRADRLDALHGVYRAAYAALVEQFPVLRRLAGS